MLALKEHPLSRSLAVLLATCLLLSSFSREALAIPTTNTPITQAPTGFWNTVINDWHAIESDAQGYVKIAQQAMTVLQDAELVYMFYNDIKNMPSGGGFFGLVGNIANLAAIGANVGSSLADTASNVSDMVAQAGMPPPGQMGPPTAGAVTANSLSETFGSISDDLSEFAYQAQMVSADAYNLQMLSTMNAVGFTGTVQALQLGISTSMQIASQIQQQQQYQVSKDMTKSMRRAAKQAQKVAGYERTATEEASINGKLWMPGCFQAMSMTSEQLASSGCINAYVQTPPSEDPYTPPNFSSTGTPMAGYNSNTLNAPNPISPGLVGSNSAVGGVAPSVASPSSSITTGATSTLSAPSSAPTRASAGGAASTATSGTFSASNGGTTVSGNYGN